jgi:YD repeat-containing protein
MIAVRKSARYALVTDADSDAFTWIDTAKGLTGVEDDGGDVHWFDQAGNLVEVQDALTPEMEELVEAAAR